MRAQSNPANEVPSSAIWQNAFSTLIGSNEIAPPVQAHNVVCRLHICSTLCGSYGIAPVCMRPDRIAAIVMQHPLRVE
jgi:hypothetical protein